MSLAWAESFDGGNWTKRAITSLVGNVGSAYGRSGDGARVGDNHSSYFYIPVKTGNGVRHIIGAHMYWAASGGGQIYSFGTSDKLVMGVDAVNQRLYWTYAVSSVTQAYLYTPINSFKPNTWHYVEVDFQAGTANNSFFNIWIDGSLELESATNIDVYTYVTTRCLVGGTTAEEVDSFYFDDVYYVDPTDGIWPTEPLGPVDMGVLLPDGNGNSSQLTGSDSNQVDNYQQVDENPPNDGTDYNGSATDGHKDTYTMDDVSGSPDVVAMMVSLNAVKTDVGTKFIKPVVRTKTAADYTTTPTMTASSTFSTYTAAKAWRTATDYWVSDSVGSTEWWRADFGSAKDMGYVVADVTPVGSTYPREAVLQFSDDDSAWYDASQKLTGISNGDTITLHADLTDQSHRYWRILFSDFSGSAGMELDSVYFYEVSATLGDDVGASIALAETYDVYDVFYMRNPGTGKKLNVTDVNAMEVGVQVSDT